MDFGPEPIMDAFTPPRPAARPSASAADDGPTFEEHLDAANEPQESIAAAGASSTETTEAKPDAPVETKPAPNANPPQDPVDPETALLGGPIAAPPPIPAPVLVQIAAAQAAPVQSQPVTPTPATQPVSTAPQAPIAPTPAAAPPEAAMSAAPATPTAPTTAKAGSSEAKTTAPPAQTSQQNVTAPSVQTEAAAPQTAPATPNSQPITVLQLPEAVRQAIAASIAPAPQIADAAQRTTRPAAPTIDPKTADAPNAKSAQVAPNAAAKTQTVKAVAAPAAMSETALQTQSANASPDASQIMSPSSTSTAAQTSTHAQHVAADTGAQRAAPAATQVGREIVRRFNGGGASFELRLDPPELGRIEVRMEVSRDHRVTAVIAADNPQALSELVRHARELEAQLQSAGLQLSENGLSFDLRQGANGKDAQEPGAARRGGAGDEAAIEQPSAPTARPIGFERWRGVRVDMMV